MNNYNTAVTALFVVASLLLSACSILPKANPVSIEHYTLDVQLPAATPASSDGPVLLIARPLASAELDSSRMAYRKQDHALQYFARSRWADTPPQLLLPGLIEAFEASGRYAAVIRIGSAADPQLRLDTELLEFSQDFRVEPSQFDIRLRVQLVDLTSRKVVASRIFESRQAAPAPSPYGGAQAANTAWRTLLPELVAFCVASLPATTP